MFVGGLDLGVGGMEVGWQETKHDTVDEDKVEKLIRMLPGRIKFMGREHSFAYVHRDQIPNSLATDVTIMANMGTF